MSYLEMSEEEIHDLVERGGLEDDMFFALHEEATQAEKNAWEHFYVHQEVFNYLLSQGYVSEVVEGDGWEASAQTIINSIKNIENRIKNQA